MTIDRRTLIGAVLGTVMLPASLARAATAPKVGALFCGKIDDHGFMEAGYRGLVAARDRLGATVSWRDGVPPKAAEQEAALRELAASGVDLVVAHGGQNNEPTRKIAAEFPAVHFVVTQGAVTGPNLSSYTVLQEHSAFLAGALAAWTTRTGTVGHISGIRVPPGLRGRAAYAAGVAHADPKVKLLTIFCGDQDDVALAERVAAAEAAAGADVIFTMLNAGRKGSIEACRKAGIKQIGNVVDWVATTPDVFVGSAIADSGLAVYEAIHDVASAKFVAGSSHAIGLENPDAVRLVAAPSVPADVVARIDGLAEKIRSGSLEVPAQWTGTEFTLPG